MPLQSSKQFTAELQLRHSSSILHSTESLNHCCTDGALPLAVLQQCRGSGALLLRESAILAAFLLTVGNLPNCSRRHRDKKWPMPYVSMPWNFSIAIILVEAVMNGQRVID